MKRAIVAPRPVMYLGELRASPQVDRELDFFFNRAEAAMVPPSNYWALLRGRTGEASTWNLEDAAEAAHAHRRIRGWLLAIPDSDAGVLQAAYTVRYWPKELYDALGQLTGIVVRLACATDGLGLEREELARMEMVRAEWLAKAGERLRPLRWEARGRFARAVRAYTTARGEASSPRGVR